MNSKTPNNVVEIRKQEKPNLIAMQRALRKALSELRADEALLPSAVAMLTTGVFETSAFETLRAEAYDEMVVTMVAFVDSHGIEVGPETSVGNIFGVITRLAAETAAQSAMALALKQVNASNWQDYILKIPKTACIDAAAEGLDREVTTQDLKSVLLELDKKLADLRPMLVVQLQPIAQFFGDHCGPKGIEMSPGWSALKESAYRGLAVVVADIWVAHGLDVYKDGKAWKAAKASMTQTASSLADELLEGAGFQSVEPASPYIN